MARATSAESAERVDQLQEMILAGQPNTACLTYARQTWGLSRSQGYRLLKKAWAQIKDDIDGSGIDRQELLSWSIQTLMAAAGQAMQQKIVHSKPDASTAHAQWVILRTFHWRQPD